MFARGVSRSNPVSMGVKSFWHPHHIIQAGENMDDVKMKNLNKDELYVVNIAGLLKAVSHPARLCIVKKLCLEGECNVSYFTGCMDVSQSGISQHLAKLKDLGIVAARKQGTESYYSLVDENIVKLVKTFFTEGKDE